ncbi:MAG: peptidyl-prolyl cis-trans isomerase [Gammaproteobacteria bacterium]|jgi:peptidyl-prolyl cis-trans isomerase C|nr:peptidyl-prolyl cis-trans isomerase [Gammaproteobacteria bacterium]
MTQFLRTPWHLVSTVAAIGVLLTACGKGQQGAAPAAADPPATPPVAVVNGVAIPRADYDAFLKNLLQGKPVPPDLTAEQKNQVLDELITMQLVSTQALKDGVDKDPEVAANLDVLRMRILSDGESQKFLKGKDPTDAELHAEYDSDIAAMDKTEYHARHILVASKEKADQLIKKLKGGAKFEDVAKAESTDNSKTSGGDLGWFTATRMVKPFADAVKALKKGETTPEPVQTQYGWHIIKLEETREVTPPPFDQVKAQVTKNLIQKKLVAYVEDMKKNAKIEKKPL